MVKIGLAVVVVVAAADDNSDEIDVVKKPAVGGRTARGLAESIACGGKC